MLRVVSQTGQIILGGVVGVVLIIAVLAGPSHLATWCANRHDAQVWGAIKERLEPSSVISVTAIVELHKQLSFTESQVKDVLALLSEAEFEESIRMERGRTPGTPLVILALEFRDGTNENLGVFPSGSVVITPRSISSDAWFLVSVEGLWGWLDGELGLGLERGK